MPAAGPTPCLTPTTLVLERGRLRVEIALRPFELTVRRAGRRLVRIARRVGGRGHRPRPLHPVHRGRRRARGAGAGRARAGGGRCGAARSIGVDARGRAERWPARAARGARCSTTTGSASSSSPTASRCGSRSTGAGAPTSGSSASARGTAPSSTRPAASSSSAPTAATPAPTARPSCSPAGASRRATARRCRGSSRAAATRSGSDPTANGVQFDLSRRARRRRRRAASAGPLRVDFLCDPTPAARLRAFCRLTGFPAVLPEWGYGFWKSRDVYGHQDDVVDDYEGLRRHEIPLDAIVIDSPWATQYNTWEFNPYQFPDAPGLIRRMRADGVRTVVWVTPWVNTRLARRADPAPARVRAAAPRAGAELRAGRGRRALRRSTRPSRASRS